MKFKGAILIKLVLIGFVMFIGYRFIMAEIMNRNSLENSRYIYNQKFDKEDSTLFKSAAFGKMKSIFNLESNYRNSLKSFEYDSLGILYYTKIDLENDLPMDQFIMFQEKSTTTSVMHTYDKLNGNKNDFYVLDEKVPKIDKIIFSLTGDGDQIHRNAYTRNFISYYLPVNTFSLRYGEEAPIDIFFGGKEIAANTRVDYPLMLSFYKVHKALYVLILIPTHPVMTLEADLFGKIMNDNGM